MKNKTPFISDKLNLDREKNKEDILIKINKKYKKIEKANIDFISSEGKYCNIHIGTRIFAVRSSLKYIIEILPDSFMRIHASYIVNLARIHSINTEDSILEFKEGISVPFSRTYKSELLDRYCII